MIDDRFVKPIVKWAGGKRQLFARLTELMPDDYAYYCEPFLGGGAMLLGCRPRRAIVNDINDELIGMYTSVMSDVEAVLAELERHVNTRDHFYSVRGWDRDPAAFSRLSPARRAARFIYLNKTCYNGLFRVNARGQFNSPFGDHKSPEIVNARVLRAVSAYLRSANITFRCGDYQAALSDLPGGSFVYLDPPYDPVSPTAGFTGYAAGGFGRADQIRLRECCDALNLRGIKFMLSNSATDFIREQYAEYDITILRARRAVNSNGALRGPIDEIVVRNYR